MECHPLSRRSDSFGVHPPAHDPIRPSHDQANHSISCTPRDRLMFVPSLSIAQIHHPPTRMRKKASSEKCQWVGLLECRELKSPCASWKSWISLGILRMQWISPKERGIVCVFATCLGMVDWRGVTKEDVVLAAGRVRDPV